MSIHPRCGSGRRSAIPTASAFRGEDGGEGGGIHKSPGTRRFRPSPDLSLEGRGVAREPLRPLVRPRPREGGHLEAVAQLAWIPRKVPRRSRDSTLRAARCALNDAFGGTRNPENELCNSLSSPTSAVLAAKDFPEIFLSVIGEVRVGCLERESPVFAHVVRRTGRGRCGSIAACICGSGANRSRVARKSIGRWWNPTVPSAVRGNGS